MDESRVFLSVNVCKCLCIVVPSVLDNAYLHFSGCGRSSRGHGREEETSNGIFFFHTTFFFIRAPSEIEFFFFNRGDSGRSFRQ